MADILVSKNDLLPDALERLEQKQYVPDFLTIRNAHLGIGSSLPFEAEFEIPENRFENSGYLARTVRVGVFLKEDISKYLKENSIKRKPITESKWQLILRSTLSRANVTLTPEQNRAVEEAMVAVAIVSVEKYRENEAKAINKEAMGLIPSMIRGELKHWIRNFYFKRAKKQAQIMSNNDNRWYYVIRKSDVAYGVFSTRQVNQLKKIGILDQSVDAKGLTEVADYVARPKNK